jgi:hypothetical protein
MDLGASLGEPEKAAADDPELARLRAYLRIASFALPSMVTGLALLLCWRWQFIARSIKCAVFEIAFAAYLAIFLNRRSRGLPASFFYASTGPGRDSQDPTDITALWGAAFLVGAAGFFVVKYW